MNVPASYYTTVSNGSIQLRSSQRSGVIQTFGSNITSAIVQGDQIVATSKTGVTYIYQISNNYAILKKTMWRWIMKYVVLFKRPGRVANMDEWFDTQYDAERRCEDLQSMFDWLYERNNKVDGPAECWVECKEWIKIRNWLSDLFKCLNKYCLVFHNPVENFLLCG